MALKPDRDITLYDGVVLPRFAKLFGEMIVRAIPENTEGRVLDIGCGTGHPAIDLLSRLGESGRVIGVDRDPHRIEVARRRVAGELGHRIFFKVGEVEELPFDAEVFDIVTGNLVVHVLDRPGEALREIRRVLKPGGRLIVTRPMAGTFHEVFDILREVALKHGLADVQERTRDFERTYATAETIQATLAAGGFINVEVEQEVMRLPFRNAQALFEDRLIRLLAHEDWRRIAGVTRGGQDVLAEVERHLDTYFGGGPLSLTVNAGLVKATQA